MSTLAYKVLSHCVLSQHMCKYEGMHIASKMDHRFRNLKAACIISICNNLIINIAS